MKLKMKYYIIKKWEQKFKREDLKYEKNTYIIFSNMKQ